jgi:hypothetical protein
VPTSSFQTQPDGSQPRQLMRDGESIRPLTAPLLVRQGLAALPAAQIVATAWTVGRPGAYAALASAAAASPRPAAGAQAASAVAIIFTLSQG